MDTDFSVEIDAELARKHFPFFEGVNPEEVVKFDPDFLPHLKDYLLIFRDHLPKLSAESCSEELRVQLSNLLSVDN